MADKIKAINAYRPRIKKGKTVFWEELVRLIAGRTSVNAGPISLVLKEFVDAIIFFSLVGRPVKLDGLGIYSPTLRLDGKYKMSHRVDKALTRVMNMEGAFKGDIINRDSIGKTVQDLIAVWNEEHPDDPVA